MSDFHVAPHPDGGWQVTESGRPKDKRFYPTQEEAADEARRDLERSGGGELVIHATDGHIREKRSVPPK